VKQARGTFRLDGGKAKDHHRGFQSGQPAGNYSLSLFSLSLIYVWFLNISLLSNSLILPILLPTPRVYHVAYPSFLSFPVSCYTPLLLLQKEQYP